MEGEAQVRQATKESGLSKDPLLPPELSAEEVSAEARALADDLSQDLERLRAAQTNADVERALRSMLRRKLMTRLVVRDVFDIGLSRYYVAAKTLIERFGEAGKQALGEALTEFFRSRGSQMTHFFGDYGVKGIMDAWQDGFGAIGVEMEIVESSDEAGEMHVHSCPFVDMWRREQANGASLETLNFLQQSIEDWGWTPIALGYNPDLYARCERSMWLGEQYCTIRIRHRRSDDPEAFEDRILQPPPSELRGKDA